MKKFNVLLAVFSLSILIASCSKDEKKMPAEDVEKPKQNTSSDKTTTETSVKNNFDGIQLYKVENVGKSSGKKLAPDFSWTENGTKKSLADLKGNVVLVNFWATWCGPCIKEMPDLSKISTEMSDKNFKMIGINVFQQPSAKPVDVFLKSNPVSYTIIDGNDELVDAFATADGNPIDAVPTTFIIDKNGKIAETIVGSRDKASFEKLINKYLN